MSNSEHHIPCLKLSSHEIPNILTMEQSQLGGSNTDGGSSRKDAARLDTLPEDCISRVIYHTSPRDACVVTSVSKTVKSAAESDLVWEMFLPTEYSSLVVPRSLDFTSKKEMYMSLADDSILIDEGKKSFWLEKGSGKKCYMLSAMDLKIIWSDCPVYWQWNTVPDSKFKKVAELRDVCWFEIRGKMSCGMLSKGTYYSVYLVFKRAGGRSYGFEDLPMEAQVGFVGKDGSKTTVLLEPIDTDQPSGYRYTSVSLTWVSREDRTRRLREAGGNAEEPKVRGDGWSEVKLGNFYINDDDDDGDEIEFSIMETQKGHWKSAMIFQGVEIRPMKEEEEMVITN